MNRRISTNAWPAVCNVPALARALGIVVDVKVDDLDALKQATADLV